MKGEDGTIFVGDQAIATKSKWALSPTREYAEAADILDPDLLRPLKTVEGTFTGPLDAFDAVAFGETAHTVFLYLSCSPAWWGRIKHRLMKTDPGDYIYASGEGSIGYTSEGLMIDGQISFTGSVAFHAEPMSRLETIWHRICTRFGR